MTSLEPIVYKRGELQLLNQILLPQKTVYDATNTAEAAWDAIKSMKVRGAPAIAISAVLGLAAELHPVLTQLQAGTAVDKYATAAEAAATITDKLDYLETSRPTAVNLRNAVLDSKRCLADGVAAATGDAAAAAASVVLGYIECAEAMYEKDIKDNKAIGEHGAQYILDKCRKPDAKVTILTHCNAGALATVRYGTALSVMRFVHAQQQLERGYCTETRPYNQGARLTAFELCYEKINTTLICDSMVSYLFQKSPVTAIVVGADRVAANGDTANKIGTYQIALSAAFHNIPFFVAAPTTTFDLKCPDGSAIPIEERSPKEVSHSAQTGELIVPDSEMLTIWNPAFDVTPANLIRGIITEVGVLEPGADGTYDLAAVKEAHR